VIKKIESLFRIIGNLGFSKEDAATKLWAKLWANFVKTKKVSS